MSDSSDTSAIDEKRNSNVPRNFSSKIVGFLKTIVVLILLVFIYVFFGSFILYGCKIGQSNILPTEENCFPYTDTKPNIQEIPTNIFTTSTNPPMSMKMSFPYNKNNSTNKILDTIREYRDKPNSYFLVNYFSSIVEELIRFNYSWLNYILNGLNQMPETVIVLIGPLIFGILSSFLMFFDNIYFIYLWFAKMSWFFKHNEVESNSTKSKWEDVTLMTPLNYTMAVWLVIIFCILFFAIMPSSPFILFLIVNICIHSLFFYEGQMNGKTTNFFDIFKDVLKHYKLTVMTIISLLVVFVSFLQLGTIPGVISLLVLLFIYMGIVSIDLFKPIKEMGLTPLTSYDQAKKQCAFVPNKKQSLLVRTLKFLLGQKGGGITNEIKSVGKKLNNK